MGAWTTTESDSGWLFEHGQLRVIVGNTTHDPRILIACETGGETLTWEQSGALAAKATGSETWLDLRAFDSFSVYGDTLSLTGVLEDGAPIEVALTLLEAATCQVRVNALAQVESIRLPFAIALDEHFFGGGERFTKMGLRGERIRFSIEDHSVSLRDNNTYFPIPFAISSSGYGLWVDSNRPSTIDFGASDPTQALLEIEAHTLTLDLFFSADPFEVIRAYTAQAGRPILPPLWNWGFWHTSLGGEQVVLDEARRLRELGIPCSALWVYDAHDPVGSIGWPINAMHHSGDYPDVRRLVNQLHDMGYKVQTYLFPIFYTHSDRYKEIEPLGYFLRNPDGSTYIFDMWSAEGQRVVFKPAAIFDFTNPAAVEWWYDLIKYIIIDLGFDGWMHDFGEYAPPQAVGFDGRTGMELHNAYPVLCHKATREACQRAGKDVSFYARCGYTGSQKWLTAAWNGDQIVSWDVETGYPCCITACLSLSMSGMPWIGPDIGGYIGRLPEYPANCDSKELWIRWTQFSAFTTIMRDHLGDKPDGSVDMWTDEETLATLRDYSRLHTALTPYWQIFAQHAVETGAPIMRHLFLLEPRKPEVWHRFDQYMVGDDLLVAPVIEEGARTREVYLPAGEWLNYWDNTHYSGGQVISAPCPLNQIPLFVRAGALVPFLAYPGDTLAASSDPSTQTAGSDLIVRHYLPNDWASRPSASLERTLNLADGATVSARRAGNTFEYSIHGNGAPISVVTSTP